MSLFITKSIGGRRKWGQGQAVFVEEVEGLQGGPVLDRKAGCPHATGSLRLLSLKRSRMSKSLAVFCSAQETGRCRKAGLGE